MKLQELFEEEERDILYLRKNKIAYWSDDVVKKFDCYNNDLTSLKGSPTEVLEEFDCSVNKLTSFKGGPKFVKDYVKADSNSISSLEGFPEYVGSFVSIEYNKLTSLHNIHKYIKKMKGLLYLRGNQITSCVLGVLMIDGITGVMLDNTKVQYILNKHLHSEKDVFACQEELIEAGLEDFAKL